MENDPFFHNILFTYYKSRKEKGQTTIYKTSQVLVDSTLYDFSSPSFFLTSIFFHVHNILQLSMYHWMTYTCIYNKYNQNSSFYPCRVSDIYIALIYICQKPGMDRNYCLIVYMSSSSNNKTLNARLLARVITGCHYT